MADTNEKGVEHTGRFLDDIDRWTIQALEDVSNARVKEIFQDCICVNAVGQKPLPVSEKQADRLAKKIRFAIIESTPKYVRAELTEPLEENKFNEKFQILHNLKEKYKDRTMDAWRPPYDANAHMRTPRVKIKEAQLNQLQLLISIKKQTITGLKDKVRASSGASTKIPDLIHEVEEDLKSISNKHADFTESVVSRNRQLAALCDYYT